MHSGFVKLWKYNRKRDMRKRKVCCWQDQSEERGHAKLSIYIHTVAVLSLYVTYKWPALSALLFLLLRTFSFLSPYKPNHSLLFPPFNPFPSPISHTKSKPTITITDFSIYSVAVFHLFATRWCTSNSNVFSSPCLSRSIWERKPREGNP